MAPTRDALRPVREMWPGRAPKDVEAPVVFGHDIKAAMRGSNYHDVVTRLDTMLGLANALGKGSDEDLEKRRSFFQNDVEALRKPTTATGFKYVMRGAETTRTSKLRLDKELPSDLLRQKVCSRR